MNVHTTRAEWDRIAANGGGALFRAGVDVLLKYDDGTSESLPGAQMPADFVEAAAPCETCEGRGFNMIQLSPTSQEVAWCTDPHCLDGKRRVAVAVPCVDGATTNDHTGCHECDGWGLVTVGHVVVTWGPLVVVDEMSMRTVGWPLIAVVYGQGRVWLREETPDGVATSVLDLPPDVDPQTLIGRYAIGVEVVR